MHESDNQIKTGWENYGSWLVKNATLIIWACLIICGFISSGVIFLKNNPDSRVFFNDNDERVQQLYELEREYSKTYNYFIAVETLDTDIFTPRSLTAILELTEDAWHIPYASKVTSLSNFIVVSANGDDINIEPLYESPDELNDEKIKFIKNTVKDNPALINGVISEDLQVVSFNILIDKDGYGSDSVFEVTEFSSKLVERYRKRYPELNFYISGSSVYDEAFAKIPSNENRILVPVMFGAILLFLVFIIKSKWAVLGILALIGLSVSSSMGATGWIGAMMNAGTAPAPIMILTLTIAHSVHIMITLTQQIAHGEKQTAAIVNSLVANGKPIIITSLTTAIGFLSLNFSDAPPFRQLGNTVAFGVAIGCALSLILLPAILSKITIDASSQVNRATVISQKIANVVVQHYRKIVFLFCGLILSISAGLFHITLDDNFLTYFSDRYEIRRDTDFIQSRLSGLNVIEYSFNAGEAGDVSEPNYLQDLDYFLSWVKAQPGVTNANAMTNMLKDINRYMNGGDKSEEKLPDSRELAAQFLLLYENSLTSGQDIASQINSDKSSSRVVVFVKDVTSRELREFNAKAEKWVSDNLPHRITKGSGVSVVFAYISESNINSMLYGSLFALCLISLILVLAFRDIKIGVISLIPNLVPAAMALGIWGYLNGSVGLSIAVVVAVTLGIVVDDTVHFLSKYLHARRELNLSTEDSIRFTFKTVGVALFTTTISLALGFMVLFSSGFQVTAEMGILSAVTIVIALIVDLLFLPSILLIISNGTRNSRGTS